MRRARRKRIRYGRPESAAGPRSGRHGQHHHGNRHRPHQSASSARPTRKPRPPPAGPASRAAEVLGGVISEYYQAAERIRCSRYPDREPKSGWDRLLVSVPPRWRLRVAVMVAVGLRPDTASSGADRRLGRSWRRANRCTIRRRSRRYSSRAPSCRLPRSPRPPPTRALLESLAQYASGCRAALADFLAA